MLFIRREWSEVKQWNWESSRQLVIDKGFHLLFWFGSTFQFLNIQHTVWKNEKFIWIFCHHLLKLSEKPSLAIIELDRGVNHWLWFYYGIQLRYVCTLYLLIIMKLNLTIISWDLRDCHSDKWKFSMLD